MRRGGIVVWGCRPVSDRWNGFKEVARDILRGREMERCLVYGDVVQPDDVPVIISELRMVVIVRPGVMWLKVSVDRRVWMVGVGFVHVLRGERRRKRDVRHQNQAHGGPPQ